MKSSRRKKFKRNVKTKAPGEFAKTKRKMPPEGQRRNWLLLSFKRRPRNVPVAGLLLFLLLVVCCKQQASCQTTQETTVASKLLGPLSGVAGRAPTMTSDRLAPAASGRIARFSGQQEKDIATGQSNSKLKFDITSNSVGTLGVAAALSSSGSGNGNQFEIAEGLTISPAPAPSGEFEPEASSSSGSGSRLSQSNNNNKQQQHQWPLKQLDRIKSESKVSALVGQNAILNCAVQFKDGIEKPFVVNWFKYPHKLPIYIWYAGYPPHIAQDYENRAFRLGQASLNLTKVRQSDQGLYECKIYYLDRRPEDKGNGTWIYLDVQAPPHFTQTPPPVSYVQPGDSLQLTCRAESTPSPILRWYKNKQPIESSGGPFRLVPVGGQQQQQQQVGGELAASGVNQLDLVIENIQAGHTTGEYACLASNSEGSIESRSQVALAIPAVITTMPRNQTRLEGEKMELLCQAKALPPNITYKWLFNDKPIEQSKWFESRSVVRHDGTLVVHSIHRDDQGEFKCQASNGLLWRQTGSGGSKPTSNNRPIVAEASAHLQVEFPARITYSPPLQYLPIGLSGLIRCFYQASPPVEFFTWTLNNQQFDPNIDPNVERLSNGSLLIKSVSKNYEGKYRCTPFNKHGSAGSSAQMEVRVEEPPQFDLKPADFYKATINGHVKIPCDAHGLPKPTISWRRVFSSPGAQSEVAEASSSSTARRRSSRSGNGDGLLVVDEPAGDEDHHLYQTIKSNNNEPQLEGQLINDAGQLHGNNNSNNNSMMMMISGPADSSPPEVEHQEQSVIISYAKLPSDRSEFKQAHLLLHGLRKEDHGRYECVVENEVATLIASTMLYIEETTPHAPTNLRVQTKTWSAQLTWSPGYDGGFEQSFVVWYRQVVEQAEQADEETGSGLPRSTTAQQANSRGLPLTGSGSLLKQSQQSEPVDLNWKSINVQPSDATSFTIQNLSQDSSYEFYVRARNIIGDGPGSATVRARTLRAISGAIAPLDAGQESAGEPLATTSGQDSEHLATSFPIPVASPGGDSDESEEGAVTQHPTVMGIIHLVDVASPASPAIQDNQQSASAATPAEPEASSNSTNKLIRIFFPSKQTGVDSANNSSNNSLSSNNTKRSDSLNSTTSQTNSSKSSQDDSLSQEPIDLSTAPQNVSMMKVAQGWVINWSAPQRLATGPSNLERLEQLTAAASQAGTGNGHLPALAQLESAAPVSSASVNANNRPSEVQPAAYSVEFREKGSGWQTLATSRERSLLLKDLKPGSEYSFRVIAHAPTGHRGSPTPEFKYLIPDNRRKPGSTQALSAGVVSGFLFFIACIVIAVCAVNMCNKRRRKRAEKAAYVMMACPVLESHHDMAALNSNSLMKNTDANPTAQGGVPGLGGHLAGNLRLAPARPWLKGAISGLRQAAKRQLASLSLPGEREREKELEPEAGQHSAKSEQAENSENQLDIKYTENAPMAVDVNIIDDQLDSPEVQHQQQINHLPLTTRRIDDDYWIRTPSDRKWGTLTLAASKLAERRAREREAAGTLTTNKPLVVGAGSPEVDSLAEELNHHHQGGGGHLQSHCFQQQQPSQGSQTLPRSFQVGNFQGGVNEKFLQTFQPGGCPPEAAFWPPHQINTNLLRGATDNFTINQVARSQHQRSMSQVEASLQQMHFLSGEIPFSVEEQVNSTQVMGKRNSFARSTLPLASGGTPTQFIQPTTNYPDNYQLMLQHHFNAPAEPIEAEADAQRLATYQRNTSNLLRPICSSLYTGQQRQLTAGRPFNQAPSSNKTAQQQIEAQFIITKPPELPPAPPPKANRQQQVNPTGKLANESQSILLSEEEALERGHLFVRPLAATSGREWPPNATGLRSLPQAGQRSEQKRLRQQAFQIPIETINAREKIESYLRHYESLVKPAVVLSGNLRNGFKAPTRKLSDEQVEASLLQLSDDLDESSEPELALLDQQTELTFQPYYNLPSLKYSISLPLRETPGGQLVLEETSHLRRSRRDLATCPRRPRSRKSSLNLPELPKEPLQTPLTRAHQQRPKPRLGSSSSCPARPGVERASPEAEVAVTSKRCSLESALNRPTFGHPDILLNASIAPDSLESSLSSAVREEVSVEKEKPPPIPPHRTTKAAATTNRKEPVKQLNEQLSRLNSLSSQQSSSSPSSSTSSSNTMDRVTTSESQTTDGDHENYEFDLISSCSSSNKNNQRRRSPAKVKQASPNKRRQIKEELYSKVVKQPVKSNRKEPRKEEEEEQPPELPPKQTARFYTNKCAKEQPLVGVGRRRKPPQRPNDSDLTITPTDDVGDDHYDTVCVEDQSKWLGSD